ncbi:mutator type transposase [Tanacetum coccineum]
MKLPKEALHFLSLYTRYVVRILGLTDLLGLDGAFIKGPYPGQLLTAMSVDPNNGIYPLAYGLVETENIESWTWFLTQLGDDLDLYKNSNFTFVSDRQKGIIQAIANLFPIAEHRYYVKHIHVSMKKKWNGSAYKELLWRATKAKIVPDFQFAMEKLKEFSNEAYELLNLIPPQNWSRSHFSLMAKSDVLLNNICEVFKGKLIGRRDKPIISTLEFAREYLMKRIVNVSGPWNDQVVVNVLTRTCTCRRWELTGIPCKHVVATNWVMSLNNQVGIPEEWVHPFYRLKWFTYAHDVILKESISSARLWKGVVCFGKKGKLAPRYVGAFEILERIGPVAYRLRLSEELSGVHDTFHVSNLKKCLADASLHVPLDGIKVNKTLRYVFEHVEIMDSEIKSLKRSKISLVKVRWNSKRGPEFTWEREDYILENPASKVFKVGNHLEDVEVRKSG